MPGWRIQWMVQQGKIWARCRCVLGRPFSEAIERRSGVCKNNKSTFWIYFSFRNLFHLKVFFLSNSLQISFPWVSLKHDMNALFYIIRFYFKRLYKIKFLKISYQFFVHWWCQFGARSAHWQGHSAFYLTLFSQHLLLLLWTHVLEWVDVFEF